MPLPFHRRRLDPDAADFCRRSGAADRAAINAFVRGIKALGLYDNMVCWPLRSSQNAGTGTVAYSLGGLGTFNGTLTNGPTWDSDGVNMQTENRRITTGLGPLAQPLSVFSVQQLDVTPANAGIVYDNNVASGSNRTHLFHNAGSTDIQVFAGNFVASGAFVDDVMFAYQVGFNGAASTASKDGAALATINPGAGAAAQFRMGAPSAAQRGSLLAFCAVINGASVPPLYSLYKSTLGTGLSLP